ncbi:MAG: PilT/PilU family type 4a pilus ATPase [Phycisphaerales bacterium]|nr:MAG: PilT/PilU family type 4a pilus ATPase [Phycisphaerales bacterium]
MADPDPPQQTMDRLLTAMGKMGASDLHLKVHYPPCFRVAGVLRKVDMPPIPSTEYMEQMLESLVPPTRRPEYDEKGDLDFSARGPTGDRFRINIFRSTSEMHAAVRRVQSNIPTFKELNLPDVYGKTMMKSLDGLILVSGVTGCGKSSTLAAMLNLVNELRGMHIITIEDPIEYVFTPKKSIISQREIGIDIPDYAEALRYVVRQDPDCIFIGEMRDRATMQAAIQAAETGHLVLGSLHVIDVQQTFKRILEFFPRNEHRFIRSSLANSLTAIMCQRLLPGIEEESRYPATEVMVMNSIVKDKILHEEDDDFPAVINQCKEEGMRSFTQSLCELVEKELVHYDTAMEYAPSREALASAVKGIKTQAQSLIGRVKGR